MDNIKDIINFNLGVYSICNIIKLFYLQATDPQTSIIFQVLVLNTIAAAILYFWFIEFKKAIIKIRDNGIETYL